MRDRFTANPAYWAPEREAASELRHRGSIPVGTSSAVIA
jgi:hypothetical protein